MEITETPNHKLILGVPSETHPQERMVSLVPHNIIPLKEIGVEVLIEHNAGINAGFTDTQYEEVGGTIVPQRSDIFDSANIIAHVRGPSKNPDSGQKDIAKLGNEHIIIGFLQPQFAIKEINQIWPKSHPKGSKNFRNKNILGIIDAATSTDLYPARFARELSASMF